MGTLNAKKDSYAMPIHRKTLTSISLDENSLDLVSSATIAAFIKAAVSGVFGNPKNL